MVLAKHIFLVQALASGIKFISINVVLESDTVAIMHAAGGDVVHARHCLLPELGAGEGKRWGVNGEWLDNMIETHSIVRPGAARIENNLQQDLVIAAHLLLLHAVQN